MPGRHCKLFKFNFVIIYLFIFAVLRIECKTSALSCIYALLNFLGFILFFFKFLVFKWPPVPSAYILDSTGLGASIALLGSSCPLSRMLTSSYQRERVGGGSE